MMIDAVIVDLEMQLETAYHPYGHFIALRFIDIYPTLKKVQNTMHEVTKFSDIKIVDYSYTYEIISEDTDIREFEITRH